MSKIEDYAIQLYTTPSSGAFGTGDYEPAEVDIECVHAFVKGYNKAEKDLELGWEDIYSLLYLEREVIREWGGKEYSNDGLCKEILRRFKERKEK